MSLGELEAVAALTDRVDVKYLVPRETLPALVDRLAATHAALEIGRRRSFDYLTTYFDTPRLATYREHLQGRRRRFKVRTRHYGEAGASVLELKAKGLRGRTIKLRRPIAPEARRALDADGLAFLGEAIGAACGRTLPALLAPSAEVAFRRTTFVAAGLGERLTVDEGLRVLGVASAATLPDELVIVESKSARGLALADRHLRELRVKPLDELSKYCLAIALTQPAAAEQPAAAGDPPLGRGGGRWPRDPPRGNRPRRRGVR